MPKFTYDEKLEHVRAFFTEYVNEYIVKDVQALMAISVPESGGGACAAPLAMTLFSAMDLLGDLTRSGKEGKPNDRTWANIKTFLDDWMSRSDEIYEYLKLQQPLIGLFRKGAVHRFFPIGCGITRHKGYSSVLHGDDGCLVLNVQALADDFLKAVGELSKRVADGQNQALIEIMHGKLLGGIGEYRETVQAQIPSLVRKVNPPPIPEFGRTEISGSLSSLDSDQMAARTVTTANMFSEMELTYTAPPPDWLKK